MFVMPGSNARAVAAQHSGPNMTKLMEVYNMSMDLDAQLAQRRVFNYDDAPAAGTSATVSPLSADLPSPTEPQRS